jgi:hypothetical protein
MRMRKNRQKQRRGLSLFPILAIVVGVLGIVVIGFGVWNAVDKTSAPTSGKAGPRLAVNQERVELGNQPFDKMVRAQFEVKNTGDQLLTLDASAPVRVVEGC